MENDSKTNKEKLKTVGLFKIFRFADKLDVFYMIIGMIGSLISGITLPFLLFLFQPLTDAMIQYKAAHENPLEDCDTCISAVESGCPKADVQLKEDMMWHPLKSLNKIEKYALTS